MALDPRLVVDNDGVNPQYRTYLIDGTSIVYDSTLAGGSASVGLAVSVQAANTVSLAADAEAVEGKLIQVESNSICRVQTGGVMSLPGGTSAGLTLGKKIVGDLLVAAEGYIREVAASDAELAVARGRIVNAATTTAVVVDMG